MSQRPAILHYTHIRNCVALFRLRLSKLTLIINYPSFITLGDV